MSKGNFEIIRYTVNPSSSDQTGKPSVYIGLYSTDEGRKSKSKLSSEQLINLGRSQSRPSGNQTPCDIAFAKADFISCVVVSELKDVTAEEANRAKAVLVDKVDTSIYILLNQRSMGAKELNDARKRHAETQYEYFKTHRDALKNPSNIKRNAVIELMLEGYPVEDAFEQVFQEYGDYLV